MTSWFVANALHPEVKDKWKKVATQLAWGRGTVGKGGCRGREGGQCMAGEDQQRWAAGVQSASQRYSCRQMTPRATSQGTRGSWRGEMPASVSHFPSGQQCNAWISNFLCCGRRKGSPWGHTKAAVLFLNTALETLGNLSCESAQSYAHCIWVNIVLFLLGLAPLTETTSTFFAGCLYCKLNQRCLKKKPSRPSIQ